MPTVLPTVMAPTPAPAAEALESPVSTLPMNVVHANVLASEPLYAKDLLALMNAARDAVSAGTLKLDSDLDAVALERAIDLIENGYFDHYSPSGDSAFAEMGSRGLRYGLAGENLARNTYPDARTVSAAYDGLMGSPGHRANILEPRFARVGIAAVKSGRTWYYVTVFTD